MNDLDSLLDTKINWFRGIISVPSATEQIQGLMQRRLFCLCSDQICILILKLNRERLTSVVMHKGDLSQKKVSLKNRITQEEQCSQEKKVIGSQKMKSPYIISREHILVLSNTFFFGWEK